MAIIIDRNTVVRGTLLTARVLWHVTCEIGTDLRAIGKAFFGLIEEMGKVAAAAGGFAAVLSVILFAYWGILVTATSCGPQINSLNSMLKESLHRPAQSANPNANLIAPPEPPEPKRMPTAPAYIYIPPSKRI